MIVGCRGAVNINPRLSLKFQNIYIGHNFRHLMLPEASIRGVALGSSTPPEWAEMGAAIVAGIEAGWVSPVINKVRLGIKTLHMSKDHFLGVHDGPSGPSAS